MPTTDTSRKAQAIQIQVQKAMSGADRFSLAVEMSLFARELERQGIRSEHPDWPEVDITKEMLRLAFLPDPLPSRLR